MGKIHKTHFQVPQLPWKEPKALLWKSPATGEKYYTAVVKYNGKDIVHPRRHRRKSEAIAQAERITEKIRRLNDNRTKDK